MTITSIRLRLLLAGAVMIVLALLASGASIIMIFERHMENRVQQELDKHLTQILASLTVSPDGTVGLAKDLADPRFLMPLSGLYWQVDLDLAPVARSRSLWDEKLHVPTPPSDDEDSHVHEVTGPDGQNLFSLEKAVYLEHSGKEKLFVVTVGVERGEISDTVLSLTRDVIPALGVLGLVLLLATWVQLTLGLRPLALIENAVHGIRTGSRSRIDEEVASEVKPLVNELNALLAANEERNRIARQRAADLAHGLRTPLTILGSLSRSVEESGLRNEADKIRLQTEHMRQQVERELARALSSAEETADWIDLKSGLERLVKVVGMSPSGPRLTWSLDIAAGTQLQITRNDFNEIFGNILENAQKWARTRVTIGIAGDQLRIDDDGPGVPHGEVDKLTDRGFTTGNGETGTGLGLAIVKQLAAKNTIGLSFATSAPRGLSVRLDLPTRRLRRAERVAHAINLHRLDRRIDDGGKSNEDRGSDLRPSS